MGQPPALEHRSTARPDRPRSLAEREQHILALEQRVLQRDEAVQHQMQALKRRAARGSRASWLPMLVGVAVFTGTLLWTRKRAATPLGRRSGGSTSLLSMFGLVWPMLPASWKARVGSDKAVPLASLLLPLVDQLFASPEPSAPPATVSYVDLHRYSGLWYEIARLPAPFERPCRGQPSALYQAQPPRTSKGGEFPTLAVLNRCTGRGGRVHQVHGTAIPVPGSRGARLKVSLWPSALRWLPGAWANYWILYLDKDYSVALVGDPRRRFLWVLSRDEVLAPVHLDAVLDRARQMGYDLSRLVVWPPVSSATGERPRP